VLVELGRLLEDKADLLREEAEASYLASIEIEPTSTAHFNLGRLLAQKNEIEKAESAYQTAHAIRPDDCDVLCNLGNLYSRQGILDKAEAAFKNALDISPDARIYSNLGVLLLKKGQLDEAEAAFRAALAIDPDHDFSRHNLDSLLTLKSGLL
jgi:tetratricopeptide (TPR) repeat protein